MGSGLVDFEATVREGGMPKWFVVENENEDLAQNIRQDAASVDYLHQTFR